MESATQLEKGPQENFCFSFNPPSFTLPSIILFFAIFARAENTTSTAESISVLYTAQPEPDE